MNQKKLVRLLVISVIFLLGGGIFSSKYAPLGLLVIPVFAHCDTMEGPVIKAAQKALETGNVKLVLGWIKTADEAAITKAFEQTLAVRKLNPQAKELADMYFFETLVRIHRAGEGAPYNGIKPIGAEIDPAVKMTDAALETGKAEEMIKKMSAHAGNGIKERFVKALEKKKSEPKSVEAAREYVEAYVEYVHYVESLHSAIMGNAAHHEE